MMQIRPFVSFLAVYVLLGVFAEGQILRRVATIDLPGPGGKRFDYLTIDEEDQFLLSAHLTPGILYLIDMWTNRFVKLIPVLPGMIGLEFGPVTCLLY